MYTDERSAGQCFGTAEEGDIQAIRMGGLSRWIFKDALFSDASDHFLIFLFIKKARLNRPKQEAQTYYQPIAPLTLECFWEVIPISTGLLSQHYQT